MKSSQQPLVNCYLKFVFRDAAGSSPKTKDHAEESACVSTNTDEIRGKIIYSEFHDARRGYQLPTGASGLALRAVVSSCSIVEGILSGLRN